MDPTITAHRTLLHFLSTVLAEQKVVFAQSTAIDDPGATVGWLELSTPKWRELGCPQEITVTIEPGDKLNEEG
jgi:hypothetical protein